MEGNGEVWRGGLCGCSGGGGRGESGHLISLLLNPPRKAGVLALRALGSWLWQWSFERQEKNQYKK